MSSQFYIFPILLGLLFNSPPTHAQNKNSSEVTMQQHNHASAPNTLLRPINPTHATIPNVSQAIIVEQGQPMYLSGHVPITENGDILQAVLNSNCTWFFKILKKHYIKRM